MEVQGLSRASISANSNARDSLDKAIAKVNTKPEVAETQEKSAETRIRAPKAQSNDEQVVIESKASQIAASTITAGRGLAVADTKTDVEGLETADKKTSEVERILPDSVGRTLNTEA